MHIIQFSGVVNVSSKSLTSIRELAELIKELVNPKAKFEFKELPMDDPTQRKPSIELARELLGWEPQIELKEGLNKTIEWFKNNI